jgi:hypothetical protein
LTQLQKYLVIKTHPGFEIREYPEHNLISVEVPGDLREAGNLAFRSLVRYISGENSQSQTISMTAPVLQKPTANGFEVSFVLPDDLSDAPAPSSKKVALHTEKPSKMAAIRFSGSANDELFERKQTLLRELCDAKGYQVIGEPIFARYNAPWTPAPLRRNEVLLPIAP